MSRHMCFAANFCDTQQLKTHMAQLNHHCTQLLAETQSKTMRLAHITCTAYERSDKVALFAAHTATHSSESALLQPEGFSALEAPDQSTVLHFSWRSHSVQVVRINDNKMAHMKRCGLVQDKEQCILVPKPIVCGTAQRCMQQSTAH